MAETSVGMIILNGKEYSISENLKISDLLKNLALGLQGLVVEHNGNIVDREKIESTVLNKGDRVELISFVGGG